ncbi:MAG TPA: diguanylate cyclase [Thermoleophilaceae bacterium]|nr:diguanylate cyclase [Thermoleophilaceae bacterium]
MSFRSRLLLFFTIIVVVPMGAVALVLFSITSQSEIGKADARIAEGLRVAFAVYRQDRAEAVPQLRQIARRPELQKALGARTPAAARRQLTRLLNPPVTSLALYDVKGNLVADAGSVPPMAPALAAPTTKRGKQFGSLAVSVVTPSSFADTVAGLTDLDVRIFTRQRRLASTLNEGDSNAKPTSGKVEIGGKSYRGRFEELQEPVGPPVSVGVFTRSEGITASISQSRVLIGVILLGFLVLALVLSVFIVRALQGQIDQFLGAARRLSKGDFSTPVPTHGDDEFAALGQEFNKMSRELEGKIQEVESKRHELEDTIRRVGDAFAAGLDRQGLLELAVRTAVEACEADAGRAVPIDARRMHSVHVGGSHDRLIRALTEAERNAFRIREENVAELLANLEPTMSDQPVEQHRPTSASIDGVHALAGPLRARIGAGSDVDYVGVISIVREGQDFNDTERDLFAYLVGQAAVSIENANLHETVQHQAVTDELTGLFNVRHFHESLDNEIERSRRFSSAVGLAMLDIDNFKSVNDTYGHQQGDLVLVEVARCLRSLSRDIDEPARYGGEELAVILPQTDLSGAELLAERMRATIAALEIKRLDGKGALKVTASFGVASLPESAGDKMSLIAAADAALYRAKRGGKNRVERAEPAAAAT